MLACTRSRLAAGKPIAERSNAISRQPFRLGPRQELLPPLVACLQPVDQLLLAARHRRERRMIARRQQLPLLAQHARAAHVCTSANSASSAAMSLSQLSFIVVVGTLRSTELTCRTVACRLLLPPKLRKLDSNHCDCIRFRQLRKLPLEHRLGKLRRARLRQLLGHLSDRAVPETLLLRGRRKNTPACPPSTASP